MKSRKNLFGQSTSFWLVSRENYPQITQMDTDKTENEMMTVVSLLVLICVNLRNLVRQESWTDLAE